MTKEQVYILKVLASQLQAAPLPEPDAQADWKALFREAWAQGVLLSFYDAIQPFRGQIPTQLDTGIYQLVKRISVKNMQLSYAQLELVTHLEKLSCPYVILKGESAGYYYRTPQLRQLGDVDFIVPHGWLEPAAKYLTENGYEQTRQNNDHHIGFVRGKTDFELHTRLAGMPEGKAGEAVSRYMEKLFENRRQAEGFFMPCDAHQAVILLLHMQHHIVSSGLGLRHIADWAYFVSATAGADFWQEQMLPMLQQIGLLKFAAVVTKMSSMYLGSPCPAWAECADESLCQALMQDILDGGNFGKKSAQRARAGNMITDSHGVSGKTKKTTLLYRTLKKAVLTQRPHLKGKSVWLHLAMTGKAFRYLGLYLVGKRPSLSKAAAYAQKRQNVYDKLEMFK